MIALAAAACQPTAPYCVVCQEAVSKLALRSAKMFGHCVVPSCVSYEVPTKMHPALVTGCDLTKSR